MRLSSLPLAVGVVLLLIGCAEPGAIAPPADGTGDQNPYSGLDQVDLDKPLERFGAAELSGTVTLNGASTTSPTYDNAPFEAKISGRADDLCLITLTPVAIPSASNSPIVQFRGTTASYGSLPYPTNNTVQYMPIYLTATEPAGVILHNSATVGGPLYSQAVKYSGIIKTIPKEDSGEPNDDGDVATITDRTMANTLPAGATFNRSLFRRTAVTNEDREDWYKITLVAGNKYRINLTNSNGTWGNWSYDLKMISSAGTTIASRLGVTGTSTSINITASVNATYYLQVVGTPITRRGGSVYYSPFSIQLQQISVPLITGVNPSVPIVGAVLDQVTFSAVASGEPTSWTWDFANTVTPPSTLAQPTITLPLEGGFTGSVVATNSAGSSAPFFFHYNVVARPFPAFSSHTISDTAGHSSLKVLQGRILVAYHSGIDNDVKFAYTNGVPSETADWFHHTVDTAELDNAWLDMKIINGVPVIAYRSSGSLWIAQSSSAKPTGTAFWTKHAADASGLLGGEPQLVDSNGRIGIVHHGLDTLVFSRATILNPTSSGHWASHVIDSDHVGDHVSHAAVLHNGRIFVSYTEEFLKTNSLWQYKASANSAPDSIDDWTGSTILSSSGWLDEAAIGGVGTEIYTAVATEDNQCTVRRIKSNLVVENAGGHASHNLFHAPEAIASVNGKLTLALSGTSGSGLALGSPIVFNVESNVDWAFPFGDATAGSGFRASVADYNGLAVVSHTTGSTLRFTRSLGAW